MPRCTGTTFCVVCNPHHQVSPHRKYLKILDLLFAEIKLTHIRPNIMSSTPLRRSTRHMKEPSTAAQTALEKTDEAISHDNLVSTAPINLDRPPPQKSPNTDKGGSNRRGGGLIAHRFAFQELNKSTAKNSAIDRGTRMSPTAHTSYNESPVEVQGGKNKTTAGGVDGSAEEGERYRQIIFWLLILIFHIILIFFVIIGSAAHTSGSDEKTEEVKGRKKKPTAGGGKGKGHSSEEKKKEGDR